MTGPGHQPRDQRPANCRNRMRSEAGLERDPNPYTTDCGSCGFSGACPHDRRPEPPTMGSGVMPPNTISKLTLACERLEAENARLRLGLEPFAKIAEQNGHAQDDAFMPVPMRICRVAKALLSVASHDRPKPPPPPPDILGVLDGPAPRGNVQFVPHDLDTRTGRTRARTSWLGFAVIEEEVLCIGGMLKWRRIRGHRIISE